MNITLNFFLYILENRLENISTVCSRFHYEWYRWIALVMMIQKNIRTICPNPTAYEIQTNFFLGVNHKEKKTNLNLSGVVLYKISYHDQKKVQTLFIWIQIFTRYVSFLPYDVLCKVRDRPH